MGGRADRPGYRSYPTGLAKSIRIPRATRWLVCGVIRITGVIPVTVLVGLAGKLRHKKRSSEAVFRADRAPSIPQWVGEARQRRKELDRGRAPKGQPAAITNLRRRNPMKARASLVLAPIVVIAITWTVGRSVSAGGGPEHFGKPLEGLTMDERKLFRDGQQQFNQVETVADGLGPTFNNVSCVACHFAPAVGGSSGLNETRAQRVVGGTHFELPGGSLFHSNAISPNCRETVPPDANVIAQRQTTPLFGAGLVEAIPDLQIEAYAVEQARDHPQQAGRVNHVVDVASGAVRVGRFGWKAQQATLLAFSGDAYLNEMGITNRLFPMEHAPNGDLAKLAACEPNTGIEDKNNDIDAFTNFMRFLAPPPRVDGRDHEGEHGRPRFEHGQHVFERVGCGVCHHAGFRAVSSIAAINGQKVDAFSDFLLHDVETGDGIIQGGTPPNALRTPPLWGISESAPYLHDGSAATITQAIHRHGNQGATARKAFEELSHEEQEALLRFLDSI